MCSDFFNCFLKHLFGFFVNIGRNSGDVQEHNKHTVSQYYWDREIQFYSSSGTYKKLIKTNYKAVKFINGGLLVAATVVVKITP